jgi:nitrate reductase NapE component
MNVTGVVDNPVIANIQDNILTEILNPILAIATVIAFALFIWGIIRFLANRATNPDEAAKGKMHFIYGLTGLFILVSLWGILKMIGGFFGSNFWFMGN